MAQTNVQAFSGDVEIANTLTVSDDIIVDDGTNHSLTIDPTTSMIYNKQLSFVNVANDSYNYLGRFRVYAPPAIFNIWDTGSALGSGSRYSMSKGYGQTQSPIVNALEGSEFSTYSFYWEPEAAGGGSEENHFYHVWFSPSRQGNYTFYIHAKDYLFPTEPSSPTYNDVIYGMLNLLGASGTQSHVVVGRPNISGKATLQLHNESQTTGDRLTHEAIQLFSNTTPATGDVSNVFITMTPSTSNGGYGGYIEGWIQSGTNSGLSLGGISSGTKYRGLTIKGASGDVGIGTNDPTATLDIYKEDTTAAGQTVISSITGVFSGSDATGGNVNNKGLFINLDSSATGGTLTVGEEHRLWGIDVDIDVTGDSDDIKGGKFLVRSELAENVSDRNTNIYGIDAQAQHNGSAPSTNIIGVFGRSLKASSSTGLTTRMIGVDTEYEIDAGTCTDAYGMRARFDRSGGGAATNSYLFYGDHIGSTTTITNNYGLYVTDVDKHYLEGNVGIGKTEPGAKLDVSGTIRGTQVLVGTGGDLGLTINDGGGNANLTFNHANRTPDQDGSSARITSGVDGNTGDLTFSVKDNVTAGTVIDTVNTMRMRETYVQALADFYVDGDVGIGTDNPVGVNGGRRLEGLSTTGFEYIATRYDATSSAGDFIGAYLFKNTDTSGTEPHYAGIAAKDPETFGRMDLHFYTGRDNYENDTPQMTINEDGRVGIANSDPTTYLDFGNIITNRIISLFGGAGETPTSTNCYGFGINPNTLRYNVDAASAVHKFYGDATEFGYVNNATGFVNSFTGQHKSFPHESLTGKTADELSGLIVCASGDHISVNDDIPQRGQDGIMVSEAIPTVCLSSQMNDKTVFGVVSNVEDPESTQREDRNGAFTSTFKKIVGDTRIYVNSIGEGAVWVVNTNGSFVNGDYITTSNVVGYGQKQDSDTLKNYTVAKITMDCDFAGTLIPKKRIKKKTVTETIEEIVEEEYESNMPEEIYTYDADRDCYMKTIKDNIKKNSRPVKQEYELRDSDGNIITEVVSNTITVEEYEALENKDGYVANITEGTEITENYTRIVNTPVKYTGDKVVVKTVTHEVDDLDEHGNLQWEDHPTETETPYKIRYLDANGVETDEANAVHKAVFVGCTYHCG